MLLKSVEFGLCFTKTMRGYILPGWLRRIFYSHYPVSILSQITAEWYLGWVPMLAGHWEKIVENDCLYFEKEILVLLHKLFSFSFLFLSSQYFLANHNIYVCVSTHTILITTSILIISFTLHGNGKCSYVQPFQNQSTNNRKEITTSLLCEPRCLPNLSRTINISLNRTVI